MVVRLHCRTAAAGTWARARASAIATAGAGDSLSLLKTNGIHIDNNGVEERLGDQVDEEDNDEGGEEGEAEEKGEGRGGRENQHADESTRLAQKQRRDQTVQLWSHRLQLRLLDTLAIVLATADGLHFERATTTLSSSSIAASKSRHNTGMQKQLPERAVLLLIDRMQRQQMPVPTWWLNLLHSQSKKTTWQLFRGYDEAVVDDYSYDAMTMASTVAPSLWPVLYALLPQMLLHCFMESNNNNNDNINNENDNIANTENNQVLTRTRESHPAASYNIAVCDGAIHDTILCIKHLADADSDANANSNLVRHGPLLTQTPTQTSASNGTYQNPCPVLTTTTFVSYNMTSGTVPAQRSTGVTNGGNRDDTNGYTSARNGSRYGDKDGKNDDESDDETIILSSDTHIATTTTTMTTATTAVLPIVPPMLPTTTTAANPTPSTNPDSSNNEHPSAGTDNNSQPGESSEVVGTDVTVNANATANATTTATTVTARARTESGTSIPAQDNEPTTGNGEDTTVDASASASTSAFQLFQSRENRSGFVSMWRQCDEAATSIKSQPHSTTTTAAAAAAALEEDDDNNDNNNNNLHNNQGNNHDSNDNHSYGGTAHASSIQLTPPGSPSTTRPHSNSSAVVLGDTPNPYPIFHTPHPLYSPFLFPCHTHLTVIPLIFVVSHLSYILPSSSLNYHPSPTALLFITYSPSL